MRSKKQRGLFAVTFSKKYRFRENCWWFGTESANLVLYSPANQLFGAYVFFGTDEQVKSALESGVASLVKNTVVEELERAGRGDREMIKVQFEFDSHQNVEANFHGNYYNRLR